LIRNNIAFGDVEYRIPPGRLFARTFKKLALTMPTKTASFYNHRSGKSGLSVFSHFSVFRYGMD